MAMPIEFQQEILKFHLTSKSGQIKMAIKNISQLSTVEKWPETTKTAKTAKTAKKSIRNRLGKKIWKSWNVALKRTGYLGWRSGEWIKINCENDRITMKNNEKEKRDGEERVIHLQRIAADCCRLRLRSPTNPPQCRLGDTGAAPCIVAATIQ